MYTNAAAFTLAALALLPAVARAQPQPDATEQAAAAPDYAGSLWSRANLFGDAGGWRTALARRGLTFSGVETAEVLGNVSGGVRRTAVFEGVAQLSLALDTGRAFGLPGGTFQVSAYQIHGRGLSANALANNLNTVSSLEAERGTLLDELWYEQKLYGGKLAIRIGQLAADTEFMTSDTASLFVNHTFGWSSFPSVDLPSGGPAYPLSTPGVRVRLQPSRAVTLLAGVYNGDPAGRGPGTPQSRNPSGTSFRLNDDLFAIAELQYALETAPGLPGTYKLGAYYHGGSFADQRRNAAGLSLADPASTDPDPRRRRRNWAVYAVADQRVWHPGSEKDSGINLFARVMGTTGDRNLINVYADFGAAWKGILPHRPADSLGMAFAIARYSDTVSALDSDAAALSPGTPIRRHESVLELTYQAQLAGWWTLQPVAQYVFDINGGTTDPNYPGKRIHDAAVLGLRTALTF